MPGDLFGTVAVRPPSVRSRRSPILVVSLAVHVVVVLTVLIGTAVAPGVLPSPREALAFYQPIQVDIKLPPPPARPPGASPPSAPSVSTDAAPVVPPAAIEPESAVQPVTTRDVGIVIGVSDGIGSSHVGQYDVAPPAPIVTKPRTATPIGGDIKAPVKRSMCRRCIPTWRGAPGPRAWSFSRQ